MRDYTQGLRDGVAIGLGYLSVSFSFGINAVSGGLSILQSALISMTNLTSAGQVAGLSSMIELAPLLELMLLQLTINIRYSLMSISLSQKLDASMTTGARLACSFFITDEIFAVASSQKFLLSRDYLLGLSAMPYIGWTLGTLLGATAGLILPLSIAHSLGIAIFGMFVAIVVPVAKRFTPVRVVSLTAIALSLIFHYVPVFSGLSGGVSIIVCAIVAAGLGAYLHPVDDREV